MEYEPNAINCYPELFTAQLMSETPSRSKGCLLIFAVLAGAALAITALKFYGGKFLDQYQRPWAYSTTEPLLVGNWRGQFRDPDGVAKTLTVRIDPPQTDDERWKQAGQRSRRRRNYGNKRAFDGTATVTSRRGPENYDVHGSIDRDNDRQFSLRFGAVDGKYAITPNFYINDTAPGNGWSGNEMTLRLRFAWHRPDGSTYSSSADPRFSRVAPVVLTRITP
jgi:hypothetical protein